MTSPMRGMAARRLFTNFILLFSCQADQATRDSEATVTSVGSIARVCSAIRRPAIVGCFAFDDSYLAIDDRGRASARMWNVLASDPSGPHSTRVGAWT